MKKVLVIRPWIYDIAAYDLWMQPIGLLYVAGFLERKGIEIKYIDCLDPFDEFCIGKIKRLEDGRGKFYRTEIDKPDILKNIPRKYCRYGLSEGTIVNKLKSIGEVDAILVTSMMTYWYPGIKATVEVCRRIFPQVPIILGGVYATLMPEHAQRIIQPDLLIVGLLENNKRRLLNYLLGFDNGEGVAEQPLYPAWHYVNNLLYLPILTSRGCPFSCSYCAAKLFYPFFIQRGPQDVVDEILYFKNRKGVNNIVFYDDALLVNARKHFLKIANIIDKNMIKLVCHSPNGLHARFIDDEVAYGMWRMNFKTICISLETADDKRNIIWGNKVLRKDFEKAMKALFNVGFKPGSVDVYLMIGMPNQNKKDIINDIKYVNDKGGIVKLSQFSPIPGTAAFNDLPLSVRDTLMEEPILQNNSIFSHYFNILLMKEYEEIKHYAEEVNLKIKKGV